MTGAQSVNEENHISAHSDDTTASSSRRGIWYFFRDLLVILLVAFVVSFVVKTFFVRSFYIPSSSMNQTLQENDRILVNQLKPDFGGVERGDVIVFKDPGGWLTPSSQKAPNAFEWVLQEIGMLPSPTDDFLIKRVIGVGGDHVVCCTAAGKITVNDVPLNEPYTYLAGNAAASGTPFDVVVPEGSYWVMGDNRYSSLDSRYNTDKPGNGFVPSQNVVGVAFVINWPILRWAWLGNYPEIFAGVEDARAN